MEVALVLELGTTLLAAVAGVAAWLHRKHRKAYNAQRERHHREAMKIIQSRELQVEILEPVRPPTTAARRSPGPQKPQRAASVREKD